MLFSYSSYKNDIDSFSTEEYIQNLENSISYNFFVNFIENYKEIENEDLKKPIFTQTNKFKKVPNTYKNYKCLKINNEQKNVWSFEKPTNENDKIYILIKTYLNKISQDTYKKISNNFINELLLINNINLFEILSDEILNKCLFDNKYRNLYINLCYKIWSNRQIHFNIFNIIEKNNNYYWTTYNDELIGPFNSELCAKNDLYNKNNFKRYFINYIQKLFINKDISFNNLNDEEIFIKKKKFILLVELIGILYLEKYINFDIINMIIINLLHLNNNFSNIEEIEFEALYTLLKLIKENKTNINEFNEYKIIFSEFIDIIKKISKNKISKRLSFFLNEIIIILNNFSNINISYSEKTAHNIIHENKINYQNIFIEKIKNNDLNDLNELNNLFEKIDKNNKIEVLYKSIDIIIDKKIINENFIKIMNKIIDKDIVINTLNKFIDNLDDIILDIPDAHKKLLYIINNLKNIDETIKNEIISKINNLMDEDD
jgi:hypothetical protein